MIGEDKVVSKNGEIAPVFAVDNNNAKAKEAAKEDQDNTTVQKISTRQIICLLAVIVVFVISLVGTVVLWGTNIIEDAIDQKLVLTNGSDSYRKWTDPPVDSIPKYWLFNYTNVREFEAGRASKLKVEEVGPFVFRERMKRVNVVFHDNGTVTYQFKRIYEFLQERSGASLADKIVSTNIPLMTMHRQATEMNIFKRLGASAALNVVGAEPFITRTAQEWFFGYKDTLIKLAEMNVPDIKVGILQEKNGTFPDRLTIFTGETDVNQMAVINRYNGLEFMDYYGADECNRVDGSDGSKFPPSTVYIGSTIFVYERDACRRIPLIGNESVTVKNGLPAVRFYAPDNIFDNGDENPDNRCYCQTKCQASGVAEISSCKQGAPLFVSFPHFFKADPKLLEAVDGLSPDKEKHQLYLDIHQRVGAPLEVKIRIQLNVLFTNGLMQATTSKLDGRILPFLWMERELDDFPDDVISIIEMITFTVPAVTNALSYIFALLMVITGIVLLICAYMEIAALLRSDPPLRSASETIVTRL